MSEKSRAAPVQEEATPTLDAEKIDGLIRGVLWAMDLVECGPAFNGSRYEVDRSRLTAARNGLVDIRALLQKSLAGSISEREILTAQIEELKKTRGEDKDVLLPRDHPEGRLLRTGSTRCASRTASGFTATPVRNAGLRPSSVRFRPPTCFSRFDHRTFTAGCAARLAAREIRLTRSGGWPFVMRSASLFWSTASHDSL